MNVETDEVPLISDMKRPQVISPAAFFVRLSTEIHNYSDIKGRTN